MVMLILTQDRRGRGWETGWERDGRKVKLVSEPSDDSWLRLHQTVRDATIEYHRQIATARAEAEHKAKKAGLLYEHRPNPVRAARFRGDQDSLQHLFDELLGLEIDIGSGAPRRSVQATTRNRLTYQRRPSGDITLTLTRPQGRGSVNVPTGSWLYVDADDNLEFLDEDLFVAMFVRV